MSVIFHSCLLSLLEFRAVIGPLCFEGTGLLLCTCLPSLPPATWEPENIFHVQELHVSQNPSAE